MALNYALYPNKVSKDSGTFRALVKNNRKYDLNRIVDQMVERRAGITRGEALQVLELFMSEIEYILEDGGVVLTPLFQAECSISGKFKGEDDHFYPSRHKVKINLRPGKRLKGFAENIKAYKTDSHIPIPVPEKFTNMEDVSVNSNLTPGNTAIISGKLLSFDADDSRQGIFLSNTGSFQKFKVEVLVNSFSQLVIKIPSDLTPGTYQLEVVSSLKTKTLRTGTFNHKLMVK